MDINLRYGILANFDTLSPTFCCLLTFKFSSLFKFMLGEPYQSEKPDISASIMSAISEIFCLDNV